MNYHLPIRMRRLRQNPAIRGLVAENSLSVADLILPVFVVADKNTKQSIDSMPDVYRYSIDELLIYLQEVTAVGIQAIALFPKIAADKKTITAAEAYNPDGLISQAIVAIKNKYPDLLVITDIALDPYTLHGHDGILDKNGKIDNDASVEIMVRQAQTYLAAGCDVVAPSDKMDGTVGAIRKECEKNNFQDAIILSYTAKYQSNLYAPFRDAIATDSGRTIDKATYQLNIANAQEALLATAIDVEQGADIIMVKPAMCYLDIVKDLSSSFNNPVFAYQVSGEYAMYMAACKQGLFNKEKIIIESLTSIKRAGATSIFTYFAVDAAKIIS